MDISDKKIINADIGPVQSATEETVRTQVKKLFHKLAEFQKELTIIPADKKVSLGRGGYNYASLARVLMTIKPVLHKVGLVLSQTVDCQADEASSKTRCLVTSAVMDKDTGRQIISTYSSYAKTAHEVGSSITYGRRYTACTLLGVVGDDDLDCQPLHEKKEIEITEIPRSSLQAALKAHVKKIVEKLKAEDIKVTETDIAKILKSKFMKNLMEMHKYCVKASIDISEFKEEAQRFLESKST